MMRRLIVLAGFSAMAFVPVHSGAATAIAIDEAKRSIVLIQGASFGTGSSFLQRGQTTYFITAAHLLSIDDYRRNAQLPAGAAKKSPSDWLTIYEPTDGKPYPAEIVGVPDFQDDLLVLKVQGMHHRPRALCLETALADTARVFVATFALPVLQAPPIGKSFVQQAETKGYDSTLTVLVGAGGRVEFSSPLEKGNSGAPIVDEEVGADLAVVSQSPYSVNSQGQLAVSDDTRNGVGIAAIRSYIETLARSEPALVAADDHALVENDRSNLDPSLIVRGGKLRLITFDEPFSGTEATGYSMSPAFVNYERELRRQLRSSFRQADGTAVIAAPTAVYPPNTDIRHIASEGDLCSLPNGQETTGVIGLRRELSAGPGPRTLTARVGLIDCTGHVIDSVNVAQVTLDTTHKPIQPQVELFVKNVAVALKTLDGPMGNRLANFAADGLPLSDAEMRGFYRVDHIGHQTYINYSWANGTSADRSRIFTQTALNSISGVEPAALANLNGQSLDALLDAAGGTLQAQVVNPATNVEQPATLVAGDRCFYLTDRAQKDGSTGIDPRYERSETL